MVDGGVDTVVSTLTLMYDSMRGGRHSRRWTKRHFRSRFISLSACKVFGIEQSIHITITVSILSFAIGRGSSADCERNSTFTDAVLAFLRVMRCSSRGGSAPKTCLTCDK